jgi:hypothetical protein
VKRVSEAMPKVVGFASVLRVPPKGKSTGWRNKKSDIKIVVKIK